MLNLILEKLESPDLVCERIKSKHVDSLGCLWEGSFDFLWHFQEGSMQVFLAMTGLDFLPSFLPNE